MSEKRTLLTVEVTPEQRSAFSEVAWAKRTSMSQLVREFIETLSVTAPSGTREQDARAA
jgi:hypothetical protein